MHRCAAVERKNDPRFPRGVAGDDMDPSKNDMRF